MNPNLDEILKELNANYIRLSQADKKRNNRALRKGGSFYENVKITEPNEYDLDFRFVIPDYFSVELSHDEPGAVVAALDPDDDYYCAESEIWDILDEYDCIDPSEFYNWFHNLLDEALDNIPDEINGFQIYQFDNKVVRLQRGRHYFDIDIVPTILMDESYLPAQFRKVYQRASEYNEKKRIESFLLVPNFEDNFRVWFPEAERDMMKDKQHVKPAYRLLKFIRDNYNDDIYIKSYQIKSLFLWALFDETLIYEQESLGNVFLQMFRMYLDAIRNREIRYFWHPADKILRGNERFHADLERRLSRIYTTLLKGDRYSIKRAFGIAS